MKKKYEKPSLICEELHPEEMLCGCDYQNPNFSELEYCALTIKFNELTSMVLFSQEWTNCSMPNNLLQGTPYYYCYQGPEVSIFSS